MLIAQLKLCAYPLPERLLAIIAENGRFSDLRTVSRDYHNQKKTSCSSSSAIKFQTYYFLKEWNQNGFVLQNGSKNLPYWQYPALMAALREHIHLRLETATTLLLQVAIMSQPGFRLTMHYQFHVNMGSD